MIPFGHAGTSGDMVGSFWSNMDPGGPPGTRVMTIFASHVVCESANSYWWNLPKMLIWPSPELIFGLLLLISPREIRMWVYQLWRLRNTTKKSNFPVIFLQITSQYCAILKKMKFADDLRPKLAPSIAQY